MLTQILQGAILVVVTVGIHAVVLGWSLRRLSVRETALRNSSAFMIIWTLARLALTVVMAHLVEVFVWAVFFAWQGVFDNLELAFYFSAVTYATIGYGDIVPPDSWRLLASIEGLTGILMCGWSGGYFFAVVAHIYDEH